MRLTRRDVLSGTAASLAAPHSARAAWPERQITLVHGFGHADLLARILSDRLPARLGQNVVVEGRPGAGGRLPPSRSRAPPPTATR